MLILLQLALQLIKGASQQCPIKFSCYRMLIGVSRQIFHSKYEHYFDNRLLVTYSENFNLPREW